MMKIWCSSILSLAVLVVNARPGVDPLPCVAEDCTSSVIMTNNKNCETSCTSYNRAFGEQCPKSYKDCGPCLPGFEESKTEYCRQLQSVALAVTAEGTENPQPSIDSNSDSKLGGGQIAAVIAVIALLGVIGFVVGRKCYNRKKTFRPQRINSFPVPSAPSEEEIPLQDIRPQPIELVQPALRVAEEQGYEGTELEERTPLCVAESSTRRPLARSRSEENYPRAVPINPDERNESATFTVGSNDVLQNSVSTGNLSAESPTVIQTDVTPNSAGEQPQQQPEVGDSGYMTYQFAEGTSSSSSIPNEANLDASSVSSGMGSATALSDAQDSSSECGGNALPNITNTNVNKVAISMNVQCNVFMPTS